jgi:hypothetical protein
MECGGTEEAGVIHGALIDNPRKAFEASRDGNDGRQSHTWNKVSIRLFGGC